LRTGVAFSLAVACSNAVSQVAKAYSQISMIVFQQIGELVLPSLIQNLWMRRPVAPDWLVETGPDCFRALLDNNMVYGCRG
jgi:hypothetical protein